MIDQMLSHAVAAAVGAQPHVCWLNALRVVQGVPELAAARYVEGFIVLRELPIEPQEHAWIESGAWIIEPTLCLFDWWTPDAFKYFAGARFGRADLTGVTDFPFVVQLRGTAGSDGYQEARQEAWGACLKTKPRLKVL
jgi:hypothetical protein